MQTTGKKNSKLFVARWKKNREREKKKRDKRTIVVNPNVIMSGTNEIHSLPTISRNDVWHRNWNRSLFALLPYILFTESTLYELSFVDAARTRILPCVYSFFLFLCGSHAMFNRYLLSFCTLAERAAIPCYTLHWTFIRLVKKKKKTRYVFD